jgi:hypothetical protein
MPVIGMPTMTVGELAEQLSASPEEIPAVRERPTPGAAGTVNTTRAVPTTP